MQHQSDFRKYVVKPITIILACLLVNAVILGLSADYFTVLTKRVGGIDKPIAPLQVQINAVWFALVYLVLFGYWATHILPAASVHILAPHFKKNGYGKYLILFSVLVWFITGAGFDALLGDPDNTSWLKWPTSRDWFTALEFALIGLVYGSMYWYWFMSQSEQESPIT